MLAHLKCYACGDSWCDELIDQEVQAYIDGHPESEKKILAGDINSVDLGKVLCDGCEDEYNQEEAALDEAWDDYYAWLDDTDGNHKSWLCETCGDPSYDCGCDAVVEIDDEIDRKAELMEEGRL